MRKNIIRTAFLAVFALMVSYSVCTSQQEEIMSDLALANVEALAQNEGGITECVGCVVTSNNLCKIFGDWGACVGEPDGYTKEL